MLEFKPFNIAALKQEVLPYIQTKPSFCSDISAGYLLMWYEDENMMYCIEDDTLVIRQIIGEQPAFSYPVGAHTDGMLQKLKEYVYQNHLPLRFFAVDDNTLEIIRADKNLQPAMWSYERQWSDYLYSFEEAMTFKGKKYSGQRNHINKFKRLYGEPNIRFLTADDKRQVETLLKEYEKDHRDRRGIEQTELESTKKLLEVYADLGFYAAGLFIEQKLAAFCIGEVVGDTLLIHIEKALRRYDGIYPTIYCGFVNLISQTITHPLKYVNREDDAGDPGLRTSKMQYKPVQIVNKYLVHINSPATKMKPEILLPAGEVVLTEFREGDKQAYFALNTDEKNNRYWGYDYEAELGITGTVNEDTFYDGLVYDNKAGDSINFAIRLSPNGELIGETILWNFTLDGTAELGCRLFPKYQGKGYGKAAFSATADFARNLLNLKVISRCYRQNAASYRMITAAGLSKTREDKDFYYFEYER